MNIANKVNKVNIRETSAETAQDITFNAILEEVKDFFNAFSIKDKELGITFTKDTNLNEAVLALSKAMSKIDKLPIKDSFNTMLGQITVLLVDDVMREVQKSYWLDYKKDMAKFNATCDNIYENLFRKFEAFMEVHCWANRLVTEE